MVRFDFRSDIPRDLAASAHSGTSFVPDRRADQEIASYEATMAADFDRLVRYADTPEKMALVHEEFHRYRQNYRGKVIVYLSARSRCMSTMIAGGSNFPVHRQQKRSATADKRADEMIAFRERALEAIRKRLCPELRPIMAGDANAVQRLREKLEKAVRLQQRMRDANTAIRKHSGAGPDAQVAALIALGFSAANAAGLLVPDFAKRVGFPDFELKNNGAEIRRLKERIAKLEVAKDQEDTEEERDHARLVDSPADNRIRLFFPGKPDADVRARLKGAGFRWTPTLGCWQAYRNHNSITTARREAGPVVVPAGEPLVSVPRFVRSSPDGDSEHLALVRIAGGPLAGVDFPCAGLGGRDVPYVVRVTRTADDFASGLVSVEDEVFCDLDGDEIDAAGCSWEIIVVAEESVARQLAIGWGGDGLTVTPRAE